ncbi:MAG: ribosome small subunit-dependent GTPase A [Candidatus Hydrogenedentales bacterium]
MAGVDHLCRISERVVEEQETLLAPGDEVLVEPFDDQNWVVAVAPRRSRLSRLAIEGSRVTEQVVAANVDVLVIVASAAKPGLKPGLIDRYLISADMGGVEPILCVNKIDLVEEPPAAVADYEALGIPVVLTSCETGRGIDELRGRLQGRLSVFAGQSGVGKSSLLNALDPDLDLATQEVSDANEKGRHTTTNAELFTLKGDIRVIDTPGIRKLGLAKLERNELDLYFPDIAEFAAACRFRDCGHLHEPECAVREALARGQLSPRRYRSYLRIRETLN